MMFRRAMIAAVVAIPFVAFSLAMAQEKKMKFEIFTGSDDKTYWRLLDKEGTNIANSGQGYEKKADCKKMVENFKEDISKYSFEYYEDKGGKNRFRLKAKNGNVVGASTGSYEKKPEAEKIVALITKEVKESTVAEVEKKEEKKDEKKEDKKEEKKDEKKKGG